MRPTLTVDYLASAGGLCVSRAAACRVCIPKACIEQARRRACKGTARSADVGARMSAGMPAPPLAVAALNLKTWINPASGTSEVVAASVVHLPAMRVDAPFPKVRPSNTVGEKGRTSKTTKSPTSKDLQTFQLRLNPQACRRQHQC